MWASAIARNWSECADGSETAREDEGREGSMTDVGLVLGAGGVVGQAYHAGVLSALYESSGWDPRSADIIVGSSAGSITGTMLRLGVGAT